MQVLCSALMEFCGLLMFTLSGHLALKPIQFFQTLLEEGKNCPGDNGRYDIKLNLLPEVTERLKDEDDGHFYDRHAGHAWLIIDAHNVPPSLFQVFELTDEGSILNTSMASFLFGDAREKTV